MLYATPKTEKNGWDFFNIMDIFLPFLFLFIGLVILIVGGEFLVRGSSSLARVFGISPFVVGLTVVAFGTSAPELIVNIFAAVKGNTDIAIGNILGSNIANILLILGCAGLVYPLAVKSNTVWKEIPFAFLGVALIFLFGNDTLLEGRGFNEISRSDGIALLSLFLLFMYYVWGLQNNSTAEEGEEEIQMYSASVSIGFVLAGLFGLFVGGQLFVSQSITIAKLFGLSEALIGLTIVAIGTSLPELVTSIIAALRKESDIAVGNVVGSNIFNIFWILGISSIIRPLPLNPHLNIDIGMTGLATIFLFAIFFIGKKHLLERWQAGIFIGIYVVYMIFLVYRG